MFVVQPVASGSAHEGHGVILQPQLSISDSIKGEEKLVGLFLVVPVLFCFVLFFMNSMKFSWSFQTRFILCLSLYNPSQCSIYTPRRVSMTGFEHWLHLLTDRDNILNECPKLF